MSNEAKAPAPLTALPLAPLTIGFGLRDSRGREIGYHVSVPDLRALGIWHYGSGNGGRFERYDFGGYVLRLRTQTLRSGEKFGASTRDVEAKSPDQLLALVNKRIAASFASYAKKIAAGKV